MGVGVHIIYPNSIGTYSLLVVHVCVIPDANKMFLKVDRISSGRHRHRHCKILFLETSDKSFSNCQRIRRRHDARQNDARQNDICQNDAHQNDAPQNEAHQNDPHHNNTC